MATWVGEVVIDGTEAAAPEAAAPEAAEPEAPARVPLEHAQGYAQARLLVRGRDRLYGMATVPVDQESVATADLAAAVARTVEQAPTSAEGQDPAQLEHSGSPAITVVMCTRDRPEPLRTALGSVLGQDYPGLQVVVVDNAPATDASARVVAEFDDPRVALVTEPTPGLSNARNTGVAAVTTPWVAFTDDDVRADSGWLRGLARGIARGGADCAAVSGFVPSGELRTPAQAWFDSRIGWNRVFAPRVFRLSEPPPDLPLFPFQVGVFGAGANFAARTDVIASLGGFDRHLGAGTQTKGGEDIDFFFRLVLAGHALTYEPSAVVWHRHRDTQDALVSQAIGYGRGFSAWATKTVLTPRNLVRGLLTVARRGSFSAAPLADYRAPMSPDTPPPPVGVDVLRIEHRATLTGPPAYLRSRARPLLARVRPLAAAAATRLRSLRPR
ncbi:GT2 family glycosyltransferase [Kineosphaera limosa]|uniref:Putative glycosyltransferase n=1 Tax=Kineosphaera limosa NBRC 100340 TaxID=1184609 RepID=K6VCW3_9MICO|nr:glycosyltransferase [Kineosphaera limosa]NYE02204.1 GT2 family glycosyltransferase [Kineosphaera limosa]GAB94058.1 putative glycosyltransferase [Kineosphaera limosa NBRC 100340]